MARSSNAKMKSEVGETREARISALVAVGLTNDAIWSAMEVEYPETMKPNDSRRKPDMPAYRAIEREKMGWAIRSVRGLMSKEANEINEILVETGQGKVVPVKDIDLTNLHRFSSGEPALDYIYGETKFIYTKDDKQGRYKKGDPIPSWAPESVINRGFWDHESMPDNVAYTGTAGHIEHGMPAAFLSIWAGSPGVGKSRLAIAMTKKANAAELIYSAAKNVLPRPVIYYNGEAEASQFRSWCGVDVDPDLFLASSTSAITLERIVQDVYQYRPRLVIIDSFQMIVEVNKGFRGTKTALSRFRLLANDEASGRPHFVFISQLNKKNELMGSRYIEHMVDMVAQIMKQDGHAGSFIFECAGKNRGGQTPRGAIFRHLEKTVECTSTNYRTGPLYHLVQDMVPPPAGTVTDNDSLPRPQADKTGLEVVA